MEWILGIIVLIILGAAFAKPSSCDVCGQSIKKTYYKWTVGGEKQVMCPKCNSQMERKVSKEAFNKKFN